jgi:hypothetical protein
MKTIKVADVYLPRAVVVLDVDMNIHDVFEVWFRLARSLLFFLCGVLRIFFTFLCVCVCVCVCMCVCV